MSEDTGIGTEIAGYRIESRIGRGGMSTVYLAEQVRLHRKVALKILDPELAADPEFRDRFERESELAASLEHPSIVPVYDAGQSGGVAWIAMRYVEGQDLGTLLETEGALDPERVVRVMAQVAEALDAAHASRLIHRDVKPANVLLQGDRAYLSDFGLTKRLDAATVNTDTGRFLGTIAYAAPEQFEGRPLEARTDQYSLACVAFHCLTGRRPYPRDQEAAVMFAHLREPPPKAHDLVPELPAAVDDVLAKGMAKAKEDRFPSCGAFAEALGHALSDAPPRRGPRVGKRAVLAIAGVLVAALALIVGLAMGDSGTSSPSSTHSASASGSPSEAVPTSLVGVRSIDAETNELGEVVVTRRYASSLAVGGEFVWVRTLTSDQGSRELRKLRTSTNGLVGGPIEDVGNCLVNPGLNTDCVAAGDGYAWSPGWSCLVVGCPTALYRIDPSTNRVDFHRNLAVDADVRDVEFAAGSVWVAADNGPGGPAVYRYVPKSDKLIKIPMPPAGVGPIAYGEGFLWVIDTLHGGLRRIDPSTNEVVGELTLLDGNPYDIAVGNGFVWVTDSQGDRVLKLDPSLTQNPTSIVVGDEPRAIAFGEGAVWVANHAAGSVTRIDMLTGTPTEIPVGGTPGDIAVGDGQVWLTLGGEQGVRG